MLDQTLKFLAKEVNSYIKYKTGLSDDKVFVSNIIKQDGSIDVPDNSIAFMLINIEEEHNLNYSRTYNPLDNNKVGLHNPDLGLYLYVFCAANFNSHEESLKFLSLVLEFFQGKQDFTSDNSPTLDGSGIERLDARLHHLSLDQVNNIWSSIGAKCMPSIMYKIRMAIIQSNRIVAPISRIEEINTNHINKTHNK